MDDRFENLIRVRDLRLAWISLSLFCLAILIVSRFSYSVIGFPSTTLLQHLAPVMIGILIATACLLSVWTSLGDGTLIRRIFFLACATLAILAAWALGLAAWFYPESVRLSIRQEVFVLGLLPTIFLSLCLPQTISRRCFGTVLADQELEAPVRPPTTTISLMAVTAIVGCCLGGIRLFALEAQGDRIAIPIAILCGFSFVVGLLITPSALLLCSRRRNFATWASILMTIGSLLIWGIIVGLFKITGAWVSNSDVWAILECTFAAMVTFTIGIGIIRLFGYRMGIETRVGA